MSSQLPSMGICMTPDGLFCLEDAELDHMHQLGRTHRHQIRENPSPNTPTPTPDQPAPAPNTAPPPIP
jgi:hypothetical protein